MFDYITMQEGELTGFGEAELDNLVELGELELNELELDEPELDEP